MAGIGHRGFMGRKVGNGRESAIGKVGISSSALGYFIDAAPIHRWQSGGDFTYLQYLNVISGTSATIYPYYQNNDLVTDVNRVSIRQNSFYQMTTQYVPAGVPVTGFMGLLLERRSGQLNLFVSDDMGNIFSLLNISLSAFSAANIVTIMLDVVNPTTPDFNLISQQYWEDVLSTTDRTELLENAYFLLSSTRDLMYYQKTDGETDLGAYPANMTSHISPSPYEILFSWEQSATYAAWKAFDGDFATRTLLRDPGGTTAAGSFLTVDFGVGNSEVIDRMILRNFSNVNAVNSFSIQGSSDNSTWTTLLTTTAALTETTLQYFNITNSTGYRYYRILFNSSHGGTFISLYQIVLINTAKEWSAGGGYAKYGALQFPTL